MNLKAIGTDEQRADNPQAFEILPRAKSTKQAASLRVKYANAVKREVGGEAKVASRGERLFLTLSDEGAEILNATFPITGRGRKAEKVGFADALSKVSA